ncbi:hypothetical protein EP7_005619 (plasmid) [Isosphaeraceae bacterium EP7]
MKLSTRTLEAKSMTPTATRKLTIIAQDPMVKDRDGTILTTQVSIPAEELAGGPWGYRVQVIDYDASSRTLYKAAPPLKDGKDPFLDASDEKLLGDPGFHSQNVYAIVMRILSRFEFALGRRVAWGFKPHQLKVAPHAFADANAFYSREHEALLFGYFPGRGGGTIFSCLSHDVVAHETTHALVDGLRACFLDPSSVDQAAFHEGVSDVVALLSVFAIDDVVRALLDRHAGRLAVTVQPEFVDVRKLTVKNLRESVLLGLGEEMGDELNAVRGRPLRQSALIEPDPRHYREDPEFQEPHRRGEILVAAMMNAFLEVWAWRLSTLGDGQSQRLHRERVAEEGGRAADYLLTMTIRGLDYCPPVHLEFGDFLSAILTADAEIRPDDTAFRFRDALRESFLAYGIVPASDKNPKTGEAGLWATASARSEGALSYSRTRFESLTRDPDEVFRFLWENRGPLKLAEGVFTHVNSVRPCIRVGPEDGFLLRETVAEYEQQIELRAGELGDFPDPRDPERRGVRKPLGMPDDTKVILQGGGTLIFDEYGRLKFHVNNRLDDVEKQSTRLQHLWDFGEFSNGKSLRRRFSAMHRLRAMDRSCPTPEAWI